MDDHIGAIFEWPEQDWCGDGDVDNQRDAVLVRDSRQAFNVCHITRWISHTLAVDCPSVLVDQLLDVIGVVAGSEARCDSPLRKDMRQESIGGAIELRQG